MSVGFDVEQFMTAVGQIGTDDQDVVTGRFIALLDEKYDEVIQALQWGDRVIIAQELANLVYVTVGAGIALGIPFDDVWAAVHESNMSRLDEDGNPITSDDGKVLRGPNYKGPEARIEKLVKQS